MAGGELSGNQVYLGGKPCPKCGHVRTRTDASPDWQCPKCGIAYLKYRPAPRVVSRIVANPRELAAEGASDMSVHSLIAANVLTIATALYTGMSLREIFAVYWVQSMVIGAAYFIRFLNLRQYTDAEGRVRRMDWNQTWNAIGFAAHYACAHAFYLFFILLDRNLGELRLEAAFWVCGLSFAINHVYSLLHNLKLDRRGTPPHLGTLHALPYFRVGPMHLAIMAGAVFGSGAGALALFAALKTGADVLMHTIEHHVLRDVRAAGS